MLPENEKKKVVEYLNRIISAKRKNKMMKKENAYLDCKSIDNVQRQHFNNNFR